jgi:hypothetical protein
MWLLLGIALGSGLLLLVLWLKSRGISIKWYEYLLGFIGLALLIFSWQNYQASIAEYEPNAPIMFLLVFGIPGLVLLLIAGFLVLFRSLGSKKAAVDTRAVET